MTLSTGNADTEEVDYRTVCAQLQFENEGLRASLDRLNRLGATLEDIRHMVDQMMQPFRKNPYLLVVACYVALSILNFALERRNCHEG
jgi:hypothetical protein